MYRRLHLDKVIVTIAKLHVRINERFPEVGLSRVCFELETIANSSKERIAWISKANMPIRVGIVATLVLALLGIWLSVHNLDVQVKKPSTNDVIQITDALLSSLVLIGGSIFFLVSLETRIKRARALEALHELRAVAHVVDMHQLTKDPNAAQFPQKSTPSSPVRELDTFQLRRYLDYCAEMLSLVGKLAAIYSQKMPDPEIVSAANDIESLCATMSQKIWQKIQSMQ